MEAKTAITNLQSIVDIYKRIGGQDTDKENLHVLLLDRQDIKSIEYAIETINMYEGLCK